MGSQRFEISNLQIICTRLNHFFPGIMKVQDNTMRHFVPKTIAFTLFVSQFFLSSVVGQDYVATTINFPRPSGSNVKVKAPKPVFPSFAFTRSRSPNSPLNYGYELDEKAKDVLRYCKESCTDSCVTCSHPELCDTEEQRAKKGEPKENATEIFCGMHPQTNIVGNVYCPANEKCVPKGWNCPTCLKPNGCKKKT